MFESDKLNKSEGDAFVQLSKTLSPLLSSGSVRLSISLLEEIILPEPLKAGEIGSRLVTLMEQDPDGHPEWHSVIQTLMKSKASHSFNAFNRLSEETCQSAYDGDSSPVRFSEFNDDPTCLFVRN